ncbi:MULTISPECIES: thiolase family protein [Rhodobacterales]|jgi:acetyl-CoA acetyltransferase|uniref:thiolase family protein n=2 Tax=Rhodobacterales TaxID=204455 RepID=UPI001E4AFFA8|nr:MULTISPECIES: thiolase family protein [Rhodobacterales]MCZ4256248.1 thiolase family protein [Sulfitobacter sp. G21635-S1]|tara:strand:+ start:56312 stop:57553 length:1242 start_codon:yes stop_codon:yes gene_type:complete
MMQDIYVIGVGMTPFGKFRDKSIKDMTREAVTGALADAGLSAKRIEGAFFSNAVQGHMEGQHMIRGEIALREIGIQGVPVVNVENACASGATGFKLAVDFLKAGNGDCCLAVGAEKMYSDDRALMFSAFDSGWDVSNGEAVAQRLADLGAGVEEPEGSKSSKPYSVFMDVYAGFARLHMKTFGTTQEHFAAVSAKNHGHSVHNPLAQYRDSMSIDQVLAAPPITYPLTLPMCAPISDGAAAAVLCTGEGLKRLGIDRTRAIRVKAAVLRSGTDRAPEDHENHLTRLTALQAYEQAGLGPDDMSLAEVHDATAVGEVIQIENLGFVPFGEGGPASLRGETTIGGRIPVNTSGGLESKGHPVGATGIGQIFELVTQLRGEAGARQVDGAQNAIAENGGGLHGVEEAAACVTILGR